MKEEKKISADLDKYRAKDSSALDLGNEDDLPSQGEFKKALISSVNFVNRASKWDKEGEWVPLRHRFPIEEGVLYQVKDCRVGDDELGNPLASGTALYNGFDFGRVRWGGHSFGRAPSYHEWTPTHWKKV